jgi:hypothetical protein
MSDDRCGEASTLGDGTPASCTLPITHAGNHNDGRLMWNWPPADDQCAEVGGRPGEPLTQCAKMAGHVTAHDNGAVMWPVSQGAGQDDQCTATTQTGFGVVRCVGEAGHVGRHMDRSAYIWHDTPAVQCTATTFVNSDVGMVACSLTEGHAGDHIENDTGRALCWPDLPPVAPDPGPVTSRYSSDKLAGANRDDLIRNLFERIEQLEQTSANARAVDHMFGSTNRAAERLAGGLGEIERRMTALEGLGTKDPKALGHVVVGVQQLSRRMDRAMTDLAMGFQERHQETGARLQDIWHVLSAMMPIIENLKPAPVKVICGAPALHGPDVCDLDSGHEGRHYCGNTTWPQASCGAPHPVELGVTCIRPRGHTAAHKSSSRGDVRLVWNDEPAPAQEERASGSPAPVRCPSQFREGQCLGYAGHDGECAAVPGTAADYQLEEPAEFAESTYDRSSDGTPLEEPLRRMEKNGPWDPDAEEGWKSS